MTAITEGTDYFITQALPNVGMKTILVSTVTSADDADTIAIDIAKYGGASVMGVIGFVHTTVNSVVIQEQPTTTMSGSTLTITIGGSAAADLARHYLIYLGATKNP